MQYRELYGAGVESLKNAQIEEAELDARLLLEFVCDTNRQTLLLEPDREVSGELEMNYKTLLEKRALHIPLQQLTGVQNFMGLDFAVNEHVLIPRMDTEILVEEIMRDLHDGSRILDMCTGSGCILISLLHYSNDCEGVGVDYSKEALQVARQNAEALVPDEQITFVHSDLFDQVEGKFEIIVSNPPYIASAVIETLMPEVRDHEPRMALDGMEDGLYFYRKIINEAGLYMNNGGRLFFEIGYDQGEAVAQLMRDNHFTEIEVKKDYAGLDRVVYGTYMG